MATRRRRAAGRVIGLWVGFCAVATVAAGEPAPYTPVEFAEVRGRIVAPVYIQGVGPYGFLVDTASVQPILDARVAGYLGLPSGPAGVAVGSMRVGAYEVRGLAAAVADLSELQRTLGPEVQGILPAYWGGGSLIVDFPRGVLHYEPGSAPPAGQRYAYTIPLEWTESGLCVDITLGGNHLRTARLDTAHGGVLSVPRDLADELDLGPDGAPRLEFEPPAEGPLPLEGAVQVRLPRVAVGGAVREDVLCTLTEAGNLPVLGTGFLRDFRVRFDFPRGRLQLYCDRPMPLKGEPLVGYGIVLGPRVGPLWTVVTAVNSPAYRAGIRTGDFLVAVGDTPLENASFRDASALLAAQEGETATFHLVRGQDPRRREVTAERLL